ncbi:MAG TPA: hypothetical protein VMT20_13230 [Terriglobia bacterium]|nr:hypothetical protein [Terriglobia bacterium]
MSKKKPRTTVRLEDRSISNRRAQNVLVDLLEEREFLRGKRFLNGQRGSGKMSVKG